MGAQAWVRAFTTPGGLFVWLPHAIMWTKVKNGNKDDARRFLNLTLIWAQIGGWLFSVISLVFSAVAIFPNIFFPGLEDLITTCENTNFDYLGNQLYD